MLGPCEWRFHQRTDRILEKARLVVEALELLTIHSGQLRFVVEGIHLARAAVHEEPNDRFGARFETRRFRRERIGGRARLKTSGDRGLQKRRQGQPAKSATGSLQKFA